MKSLCRLAVVLLVVLSVIGAAHVALARPGLVAVYFQSIAACAGDGGWFVAVTGDSGVTNVYLLCDGGLIP